MTNLKQVKALLEGDEASAKVLENEGYVFFGHRLNDRIYENEHNKIVVYRDHVSMVYDEPWKNANVRLDGKK